MDVLMPQLGETVAEGKITKWFKAAGDAVKSGDNLFEIETDKTSMEVPSTTSGTLSEIRFKVGDVAKVGAVVAVISGAGAAATSAPASQPPKAPAAARVVPAAPLAAVHSTPMPRPVRWRTRFWMSPTAIGSMPAKGSSSSMKAGEVARARQISRRRLSPPERV